MPRRHAHGVAACALFVASCCLHGAEGAQRGSGVVVEHQPSLSEVELTLDTSNGMDRVVLRIIGPETNWHAVAFGKAAMLDSYAIAINKGGGYGGEWKLKASSAASSGHTKLTDQFVVKSQTVENYKVTTILHRELAGSTADHYTFSDAAAEVPVISCLGNANDASISATSGHGWYTADKKLTMSDIVINYPTATMTIVETPAPPTDAPTDAPPTSAPTDAPPTAVPDTLVPGTTAVPATLVPGATPVPGSTPAPIVAVPTTPVPGVGAAPDSDDSSLGTGEIVLIIVAVVAVLLLSCLIALRMMMKRKKKEAPATQELHEPLMYEEERGPYSAGPPAAGAAAAGAGAGAAARGGGGGGGGGGQRQRAASQSSVLSNNTTHSQHDHHQASPAPAWGQQSPGPQNTQPHPTQPHPVRGGGGGGAPSPFASQGQQHHPSKPAPGARPTHNDARDIEVVEVVRPQNTALHGGAAGGAQQASRGYTSTSPVGPGQQSTFRPSANGGGAAGGRPNPLTESPHFTQPGRIDPVSMAAMGKPVTLRLDLPGVQSFDQTAYRNNVAREMGLRPDQVEILDVRNGSVIVKMRFRDVQNPDALNKYLVDSALAKNRSTRLGTLFSVPYPCMEAGIDGDGDLKVSQDPSPPRHPHHGIQAPSAPTKIGGPAQGLTTEQYTRFLNNAVTAQHELSAPVRLPSQPQASPLPQQQQHHQLLLPQQQRAVIPVPPAHVSEPRSMASCCSGGGIGGCCLHNSHAAAGSPTSLASNLTTPLHYTSPPQREYSMPMAASQYSAPPAARLAPGPSQSPTHGRVSFADEGAFAAEEKKADPLASFNAERDEWEEKRRKREATKDEETRSKQRERQKALEDEVDSIRVMADRVKYKQKLLDAASEDRLHGPPRVDCAGVHPSLCAQPSSSRRRERFLTREPSPCYASLIY